MDPNELIDRLKQERIEDGNVLIFQPILPAMPMFKLCTVQELVEALLRKNKKRKGK